MEKNLIKLHKLKADGVDFYFYAYQWLTCEYSCILANVVVHKKKYMEDERRAQAFSLIQSKYLRAEGRVNC